MTVSSTTVKNSYSGNGSTTQFAYGFKIFADSDLIVIIRTDSTGAETVKTLTTHYTVAGAGDASGGSITFTSGNTPASGQTVVIIREVPQTQAIDYIANDPFPAESHEEGLDRATMTTQQVQEELDRSIKLSRTNTMTSTEFTVGATDRANKVLSFDSSGELSVTQELGTFKGTDATTTTAAYVIRDIVKSTTAGQLNNVYICIQNSPAGTALTNTAYWSLLVDAVSAGTSATSAAGSATAAANSATASANSATASANSASAASTSETNAANSASTSSTQATNSANSATASANSAAAAEATFDLFDDSYLGSKSSDPSVDNDGNALKDGALYFDTTNDVMKVYNLANTTWYQLTPTVSNQTNINTVAGISSDVTSVANISSDVTATANNNSNITTVAGQITPTNNVSTLAGVSSSISTLSPISSNITTVAGISGDVTSVANISTAVSNVNSNSTNINTVATDLAGSNNIGTVSGSITNVNNVGGSISNVNSVASNLASVNNFGEVYRIASSAPTTSLNSGDLYFNTSTNVLNVYGASGWQNAGSSVNGTSQRYNYTATSGQTTFTGADNNGNTLTYDAGYIDVYLNGVKLLNGTDVTVTSGSSVVLASGANLNDVIDITAYGTFSVASLNADNLDSGTVPDARITGAYTGITNLTMSGDLTVDTNTLKVDSTNNRVGIGISSPTAQLHIENSSTEATALLKTTASDTGVTLVLNGNKTSNTAGIGSIQFQNSGDSVGMIRSFRESANDAGGLSFWTQATGGANSERMRIDSSGNFMVGTTVNNPYTSNVNGVSIRGSNTSMQISKDGNASLLLNRKSSDGQIIQLGKDGSAVGSIDSVNSVGIQIVSGSSLDLYSDNANGVRIDSTGRLRPINDNSNDLGNTNKRWNDLWLGGGLYVGGTGTANKLDDYEEGTWTPTAISTSDWSGFVETNMNVYMAQYTKVGRKVTVMAGITFPDSGSSALSAGDAIQLSGLPFSIGGSGTDDVYGAISPQVFLRDSTNGGIAHANISYLDRIALRVVATHGSGARYQSGLRLSCTYFTD